MDSSYNHPRISVQIGEEIQGDGEAYFKITGAINSEGAEKQKQSISQLCSDLEIDKSIIIVLKSESSDATELKNYIDEIYEGKEGIFKEIMPKIKDDDKAKIKVQANGDKVFIQIKAGSEIEEMVWGPFQMVLDSGLQDLCTEQKNEFELLVKTNKGFDQLIDEFEKKEQGIGANIFEQAAAKISLRLDKNLIESVMGIIKNFDPELAQIPPLLMLTYFKNFILDLKFNSTNELPPDFKKHFLTPKKYYDDDASSKEAKDIPEEVKKLIDLLGGELAIYATIENTAAIKIEAKGHNLTKLLQKFGGIFKK